MKYLLIKGTTNTVNPEQFEEFDMALEDRKPRKNMSLKLKICDLIASSRNVAKKLNIFDIQRSMNHYFGKDRINNTGIQFLTKFQLQR